MKSDTNNHSIGFHLYKMSREGDSINKNKKPSSARDGKVRATEEGDRTTKAAKQTALSLIEVRRERGSEGKRVHRSVSWSCLRLAHLHL